MFSGLIPGLNSVDSTEDEFAGQVPPSFRILYDLCLTFSRRVSSDFGVSLEFRTLAISFTAGMMLLFASIAWLIYSKKKGTYGSYTVAPLITKLAGELPESDAEASTFTPMNDVIFNGNKGEIVPVSDAKYIEELQVQEALLASFTSQMENNASSSEIQARPTLKSYLVKIEREVTEPSQCFCEICLENKESWQMFSNESCSHSFCYDCTSKHIIAKIQENIKMVACPGVNCKAVLDFNDCRLMIPKDILIQWDESLCKSLIPESQKLYCPFRDCSTMLVDDSEEVIREIKCPVCQRSFCALCHVPWHSEFTCKEFQKLNAKKRGRDDVMVKTLAKKKNWRKCPYCKIYVEKTEGCLHITCRCGNEFCYRCGSKWGGCYGRCRQRS